MSSVDPGPGRVQRLAATMRKLQWPVALPALAIYMACAYVDGAEWVRPYLFTAVVVPFLVFPGLETVVRNVRMGYNSEVNPRRGRRR